MSTLIARTRTVGIVLGIAAALVLGFGPRSEACAPPISGGGPAPYVLLTPHIVNGGEAARYVRPVLARHWRAR